MFKFLLPTASFLAAVLCILSSATHATPQRCPFVDTTYAVCKFCTTDRYNYFITNKTTLNSLCDNNNQDDLHWSTTISTALLSYGNIQGEFWESNTMAQAALAHLIKYMPIRDSIRLYSDNDDFLNFLFEHIRYALLVRTKTGAAWAKNIPDAIFLDHVLPYSFLDEKRDVKFSWRRRFYQLFLNANVTSTQNITAAMHYLADTIPHAHATGLFAFDGGITQLNLGPAVRWQSETSPMRMSPSQVINLGGGSCTGTGTS